MDKRKLLKQYPKFAWLVIIVYNIINSPQLIKYLFCRHIFINDSLLKKCNIHLYGKEPSLRIEHGCVLRNVKFVFGTGSNSKIFIGKACRIFNCEIRCEDTDSFIEIGDNTTIQGAYIESSEGRSIHIGKDCMFSNKIEIRNGDGHSIIDLVTGIRTNKAKDIYINDHVWLGANVTVLKRAVIPPDCIIGNGSVVTSELKEKNSIYIGTPAHLVKKSVSWCRERI